jgi:hypothetical protein
MTHAAPYLTVTDLEKRVTLLSIVCPLTIGAGVYRASAGGAWVELHAAEPRISTGAAPLRALELRATGGAAEQALRLEAELRAGAGPLRMEEAEGRPAFSVSFRELRSALYLYGTFHRDRDEPEVSCRVRLGDKSVQGVAIDAERANRRGLAMTELSPGDEAALLRAFAERLPLVVEQLPWD